MGSAARWTHRANSAGWRGKNPDRSRSLYFCFVRAHPVGWSIGARVCFWSIVHTGTESKTQVTDADRTWIDRGFYYFASDKSIWRSTSLDYTKERMVYL